MEATEQPTIDIDKYFGMQVSETSPENDTQDTVDESDVPMQDTENDTIADSTETVDAESDDTYEYPEWIEEDLRPKKFENEKDEINFYKSNYKKLIEKYKSEDFITSYAERYGEYLTKQDANYEQLKAIKAALNGEGGDIVAKLMFNDALSKAGYDTTITKEQAKEFIDTKLSEVYGNDWQNKYNADDELDPTTYSGKIYRDKNKLINAFSEHKSNMPSMQPMDEAKAQEIINKEYETHFKTIGIPRETYDDFINEIKTEQYQVNAMDLYRAKYFDTWINEAYKRGIDEGRKKLRKEIDNVSDRAIKNHYQVHEDVNMQGEKNNKPFTIDDLYRTNAKGI